MFLVFTGYDRMLGSHYDQYIIVYLRFKPSIDDPSGFDYPDHCIDFPGPGDTLAMAEHPMFEFIGSPDYTAAHQSNKIDKDFSKFKEIHSRLYENEKEEEIRKFNFRHNFRYKVPCVVAVSCCYVTSVWTGTFTQPTGKISPTS